MLEAKDFRLPCRAEDIKKYLKINQKKNSRENIQALKKVLIFAEIPAQKTLLWCEKLTFLKKRLTNEIGFKKKKTVPKLATCNKSTGDAILFQNHHRLSFMTPTQTLKKK